MEYGGRIELVGVTGGRDRPNSRNRRSGMSAAKCVACRDPPVAVADRQRLRDPADRNRVSYIDSER